MKRTLTTDLILYLSTTISLVVVLIGVLSYYRYIGLSEKQLKNDIENTTKMLEQAIIYPMWDEHNKNMITICNIFLNKLLVGIRVKQKDEQQYIYDNFDQIDSDEKNLIEINEDIIKNKGNQHAIVIGHMALKFSKKGIIETKKEMVITLLLSLVSIIFIIVVGTFFIMIFF